MPKGEFRGVTISTPGKNCMGYGEDDRLSKINFKTFDGSKYGA
jgi:hypothetical protein